MKVVVKRETGYDIALEGLSLSYNVKDFERMKRVLSYLSFKDGGHNKFLESIIVWLDIEAPRYWWSQFDTYRIGMTKQSESTMHTILKNKLKQNNFEGGIPRIYLMFLNFLIKRKKFKTIKRLLPENFIQRRIITTNYKTLKTIIDQRKNHKLYEWQYFIEKLEDQLRHIHLIDN